MERRRGGKEKVFGLWQQSSRCQWCDSWLVSAPELIKFPVPIILSDMHSGCVTYSQISLRQLRGLTWLQFATLTPRKASRGTVSKPFHHVHHYQHLHGINLLLWFLPLIVPPHLLRSLKI